MTIKSVDPIPPATEKHEIKFERDKVERFNIFVVLKLSPKHPSTVVVLVPTSTASKKRIILVTANHGKIEKEYREEAEVKFDD